SPNDLSLRHISQTDMNRLWYCAVTLSRDECFGLRMGRNVTSPTMQLLSLAAHSSPTAGDAIHRGLRFLQVFTTPLQLYSVEDEHYLTAYFEPKGAAHPLQIEALVSRCATSWRELGSDTLPLITEVRLNRESDTRLQCEDILGTRVRLGSKRVS